MNWDLAKDIILDALKDSALVFLFVFIVHVILGLIDYKFANFLLKKKKTAPIFGSLFGLIPQCGTSVLGADLYIKKYITVGTLIAIFLSCSDEAIISMLTRFNERTIMVIPLICLKFVIGFVVGILVDTLCRKQEIEHVDHVEEERECHTHHHENDKVHKLLVHSLIHALEIFAYVLIINLVIGFIIGFVGEGNFVAFLSTNKYLSPLFACIFGLIPNCASSLLLSELFMSGHLSFGALLGGLLVNSGLGMMVLLKSRIGFKKIISIFGLCFIIAVISAYLTCLILTF